MPFTHYPKLDAPCWGSFIWHGEGDPRNTLVAPLAPGEIVTSYGSAINFTRYLGTVFCDQPLQIDFDFANDFYVIAEKPEPAVMSFVDEGKPFTGDVNLPARLREFFPVNERGLRAITDEDLPSLHFDGSGLRVLYQPGKAGKPPIGDHFFVPIYGLYLRVSVMNRGEQPCAECRVAVLCSVF